MTNTAAAHIITTDATALGDPESIIMTRDEGMGAEEIERWPLSDADDPSDWHEIEDSLTGHGWRVISDPRIVEPGYSVADVERV